jgi:hypothetical protein
VKKCLGLVRRFSTRCLSYTSLRGMQEAVSYRLAFNSVQHVIAPSTMCTLCLSVTFHLRNYSIWLSITSIFSNGCLDRTFSSKFNSDSYYQTRVHIRTYFTHESESDSDRWPAHNGQFRSNFVKLKGANTQFCIIDLLSEPRLAISTVFG